jgi:hypothetical protein
MNSLRMDDERKGKPFCFCSEVTGARMSGDEQPIKKLEKHHQPPAYMLKILIIRKNDHS